MKNEGREEGRQGRADLGIWGLSGDGRQSDSFGVFQFLFSNGLTTTTSLSLSLSVLSSYGAACPCHGFSGFPISVEQTNLPTINLIDIINVNVQISQIIVLPYHYELPQTVF